jgi:hypothetical protein
MVLFPFIVRKLKMSAKNEIFSAYFTHDFLNHDKLEGFGISANKQFGSISELIEIKIKNCRQYYEESSLPLSMELKIDYKNKSFKIMSLQHKAGSQLAACVRDKVSSSVFTELSQLNKLREKEYKLVLVVESNRANERK